MFWLTSPSSTEELMDTLVSAVRFQRSLEAVSKGSRYMKTRDSAFRTREGAFVGMTYREARKLTSDSLGCLPGWAFVLKLPDGWNAAFGMIDYDSRTMEPDSTVDWFYRKDI